MKKLSLTFVLLFCVALIVGCGPKRPEGMPPLVSCVLTILCEDGAPVDNAVVTLIPENPELRQWAIAGSTNASGVVTITTHGDFAGAPAGRYKVTVRKVEMVETGEVDEFGPVMGALPLIEEEFSNPSQTPLELEIGSSSVREEFRVRKNANPVLPTPVPM